jgi:hypothetical protein
MCRVVNSGGANGQFPRNRPPISYTHSFASDGKITRRGRNRERPVMNMISSARRVRHATLHAPRTFTTKVGDPDSFFVDFQCWPDTVDPRGAKGK